MSSTSRSSRWRPASFQHATPSMRRKNRRSPTSVAPEARFDGKGVDRSRTPKLRSLGARAKPYCADTDRGSAGALPARHKPHAVSAGQSWLRDRLQRATAKLSPAFRRSSVYQLALGPGETIVLGCAVSGAARHVACVATELSVAFRRIGPHLLPDPDGATADCGRGDLEADLHARHQPALLRSQSAEHDDAVADLQRRFRAYRDHHRRYLGMAAVYLSDGAGITADDPRGVFRGPPGRWREPHPDLFLCHATVHRANPGHLGDVSPDR